ncbi:MAG TPA: hypothetical protein VHD37_02280 [Candidatus Paceibacterota bacterium]|nr:hypothetical protein [Candidatus Paceibacterota bacterium]
MQYIRQHLRAVVVGVVVGFVLCFAAVIGGNKLLNGQQPPPDTTAQTQVQIDKSVKAATADLATKGDLEAAKTAFRSEFADNFAEQAKPLTDRLTADEGQLANLAALPGQVKELGTQVSGLQTAVAAKADQSTFDAAVKDANDNFASLKAEVDLLKQSQAASAPPAGTAAPDSNPETATTEPPADSSSQVPENQAEPDGSVQTSEDCMNKNLVGAALAACLAASASGASATAVDGTKPFMMGGVSYSDCKAAQQFMFKADGTPDAEYQAHCAAYDQAFIDGKSMKVGGGTIPTAGALFSEDDAQADETPVLVAGGTSNLQRVRNFLKNYQGPVWYPTEEDGPILHKYMNKPAPKTAVPCKPPGYDHVVLCNPK